MPDYFVVDSFRLAVPRFARQVWNDSGTTGRAGSFWIVNRMQLMAVVPGRGCLH